MAKDDQRTLTPRLRFPKFRKGKAWEQRQAGELFTNRIEHGEEGLPIYSVTMDHGMVKRSSLDRKFDDIADSEGNKKVHKNDIAYNMMRMWQGAFGVAVEDCMVSPAYVVLTPQEGVSSDFFGRLLKTPSSLRTLTSQSHGLTKDRLRLYYKDFAQIPLPLPSLAEQQKIADCLTSLDELIAAQGRKVEALKAHQKGLMQQLFPREAETLPRLRFPEFRNAPEWEEEVVGEVFKVTRGEVLAMPLVKDERTDDAPYPVYSSQTKNLGLAGYFSKHLYEDAITWTTDGANAGDVNYRPGKFYCTNVCGVLISEKGYANPCTAALINNVSRQHVSYVGNPKLMNGVMAKICVAFPPLAEQQRIADCLSTLDARIAAETEKLAALKTHKQGLMQQLFPSPEEVV